MSGLTGPIKQIACGRRRPEMTRKEYNDHRFRIHGALSDANDPDARLEKYIQTPIFDYADGARLGGLNLNHVWTGHDDTTELFFKDLTHLKQVFSSAHVKKIVGPDGPFFADFEATMVLLAKEYPVPLPSPTTIPTAQRDHATVALYFLSTPTNERNGATVRDIIEPEFVRALTENAASEIWALNVNVGFTSTEFNLNAYFGGGSNPQYALVYKVFMKSAKSVPWVRKAQKAFEKAVGEKGELDFSESFIVFGKEALVVDNTKGYENGIRFDKKRQPVFDEAEYQQAVSYLDM